MKKVQLYKFKRIVYSAIALGMAISVGIPSFLEHAAAAQLTTRSIQMSDAQFSDTNVSYKVGFTVATTHNVQGIIVDFCDNDPLVADTTCTAPGGFSLTATPAVNAQSGGGGGTCNLSTFTTAAQLNSNRTLELTAASAVSLASGCNASFTITTVTNPNTANHTFYARIYTYDTTANANAYSAGGTAGVVDSGGDALSTSNTIQITANVQEELTFCVSGVAIDDSGGACTTTGGLTQPLLTIGHLSGGTTKVLDNTAVDTANAFTEISTNALNGWVVNMKAFNSCTGLSRDSGSTCPIAGQANAVVTAGEHNTNPGGAFEMCVHAGANTTVAATYLDTTNSCPTGAFNATSEYGMGTTTNTYGDQIFSGSTGVLEEKNTCVYAATAAAVTPAGIYKANESLIATSTF